MASLSRWRPLSMEEGRDRSLSGWNAFRRNDSTTDRLCRQEFSSSLRSAFSNLQTLRPIKESRPEVEETNDFVIRIRINPDEDYVKPREVFNSVLNTEILPTWRSKSIADFVLNRFGDEKPENMYENVDDSRHIEHSKKTIEMVPKKPPIPTDSISPVTYRFYDKNMKEQNSLSSKTSALMLKQMAIRQSLLRSNKNRTLTNALDLSSPKDLAFTSPRTVNGKQLCGRCSLPLGSGQAMSIDCISLFFHMKCFCCVVCGFDLFREGEEVHEVRVSGTLLFCARCFQHADYYQNRV